MNRRCFSQEPYISHSLPSKIQTQTKLPRHAHQANSDISLDVFVAAYEANVPCELPQEFTTLKFLF